VLWATGRLWARGQMVRPWTGDFLRDGRLNGRNGEKKKSHKKIPGRWASWAVFFAR